MKRKIWDRPDVKQALGEPCVVVLTIGQASAAYAALSDAEVLFAAAPEDYPYPEICAALARIDAVLDGAR